MDIVECLPGFTYADRPTALVWEGRRLEVDAILATWRAPGARCFRALAGERQVFDLVFREDDNFWQIIPFQEQ